MEVSTPMATGSSSTAKPDSPAGTGWNWLTGLSAVTISEIAYSIDEEGSQTLYYSLRNATEQKTLCLLQSKPTGVLSVMNKDTGYRYFHADNVLYFNTLSKVYTTVQTSSNSCKVKRVLGYLDRVLNMSDKHKTPITDILMDRNEGTNLCYYIQHFGLPPGEVTKISAVPKYNSILMRFRDSLDIDTKAMLICFAKKLFRAYFSLSLSKLHNCGTSLAVLHEIIEVEDKKLNPTMYSLHLKEAIAVPSDPVRQNLETFDSRAAPKLPALESFVIEKAGKHSDNSQNFFLIVPKSPEKDEVSLPFVIHSLMAKSRMAYVKDSNTLKTLFYLNNVTEHLENSYVVDLDGPAGHIAQDKIYDKYGKEILHSTFQAVPSDPERQLNYTIFECHTTKCPAIAFISYDGKGKQVVITFTPTVQPQIRMMIHAFAIKVIHSILKLHLEVDIHVSGLEEVAEVGREVAESDQFYFF